MNRRQISNFQEFKSGEPSIRLSRKPNLYGFRLRYTTSKWPNRSNFQLRGMFGSPDLCSWNFEVRLRRIFTLNNSVENSCKKFLSHFLNGPRVLSFPQRFCRSSLKSSIEDSLQINLGFSFKLLPEFSRNFSKDNSLETSLKEYLNNFL